MEIGQVVRETSKALSPSQAILLYFSIVMEGNRSSSSLNFLPENDQKELRPFLEKLLTFPSYDRRFPLLDEIQRISQKRAHYALDEMDGSWILHYLKNEKPAIIALILKHLPADKVYQILNFMSPELRSQLPDTESIEKVPEEIVQVVRERFEEKLEQISLLKEYIPSHYYEIHRLSSQELIDLIKDIGLDLLALSFQGVNERSLVELVQKLEREDAEKLFDKFNIFRRANRGDIKGAQLEILNLSLDFTNGQDLIVEAGVQRLARSLVNENDKLVMMIQHKLPLKSGYQLRRYVDDQRRNKVPKHIVESLQHMILGRIHEMKENGKEISKNNVFEEYPEEPISVARGH